jgi:hypothetical protein
MVKIHVVRLEEKRSKLEWGKRNIYFEWPPSPATCFDSLPIGKVRLTSEISGYYRGCWQLKATKEITPCSLKRSNRAYSRTYATICKCYQQVYSRTTATKLAQHYVECGKVTYATSKTGLGNLSFLPISIEKIRHALAFVVRLRELGLI